ncbi:uncharacterized protein VTP21DRAFT_6922 [Calcarisporiella thermophila]|uniref:uncharacterized protein n=1 Tax=Calcarisporiella thermophila TaxID=911321 RepID=UPI00374414CD
MLAKLALILGLGVLSAVAQNPPAPSTERVILPQNVKPTHYDLTITPNLAAFTYEGDITTHLIVQQDGANITFNDIGHKVLSATVRLPDKEHAIPESGVIYDIEGQRITVVVPEPLKANTTALLNVRFSGNISEGLSGFYRSKYTVGNETRYMASTDFEPADARRAFPSWDEPNLKATYNITLVVPQDKVALSNMNVLEETNIDGGLKRVRFAQSVPISTYLVAFAVGEFEYIEAKTTGENNGGKPVLCRVYTTPGNKELGKFALDVATRVLEYYAKTFKQPYPLPKLDMLAVPDFSSGAMENWGLVTYRASRLYYDEKSSSASQKLGVASVVAHELAHQWTGNLVTMDWWNDLWLNEGFATWIAALAVDTLFPEWNHWTYFVADEVESGLILDALRSSHPIEANVRAAADAVQIFDDISYSKGSSVIRMADSYLTQEVFLKGVSAYLDKHKFGNAKTSDLWATLGEISGIDVNKFMSPWTKVVGFPLITVDQPEPGKIHVKQNRFIASGDAKPEEDTTIWPVPLFVYSPDAGENATPNNLTLTEREGTFEVKGNIIKLNHDFDGVYRVKYSTDLLNKIIEAVKKGGVFNDTDRLNLITDAVHLAKAGYDKTSNYLSLVQAYQNEQNPIVLGEVATGLASFRAAWSEQPQEARAGLLDIQRKVFANLAKQVGWDFADGEDYITVTRRTNVLAAAARANDTDVVNEAKARFNSFVQGNASALNPNVRQFVYEVVVATGGVAEYEAVLKLYRESPLIDQKLLALRALGYAKQPELIQRTLNLSLSSEVRNQDINTPFAALGNNPEARPALWAFIKENWKTLLDRYQGTTNLLGNIIKSSVGNFASQAALDDAEAFFKQQQDTSSYTRHLQQAIESARVRIGWVTRDAQDVANWLKSNPN